MPMTDICPMCGSPLVIYGRSSCWRDYKCSECGLFVRLEILFMVIPDETSQKVYNDAMTAVMDCMTCTERIEPCPN